MRLHYILLANGALMVLGNSPGWMVTYDGHYPGWFCLVYEEQS